MAALGCAGVGFGGGIGCPSLPSAYAEAVFCHKHM